MTRPDSYTVSKGDTLSLIAKRHQTSVLELVRVNRLEHPDRIEVGQSLVLPAPKSAKPVEKVDWSTMSFQFRDALQRPIAGMPVSVLVASDKYEAHTDHHGCIAALAIPHQAPPVTVSVAKVAGGEKTIATIESHLADQHIVLTSPKVKVTTQLRKHEGPATVDPTPVPTAPGTERSTRDSAGHPVHEIALECPNPQNLKLLANHKYRDIVIAAAKRHGLSPQTVTAIMNAEAAKKIETVVQPVIDPKTKKQKTDKHGKGITKTIKRSTGEWDSQSSNPRSSARGMTQFLDSSWLDLAFNKESHLHQKLKKSGFLTYTEITTGKGKNAKKKTVAAFKLANGTLVTKQPLAVTLRSKKYIPRAAQASDANLQTVLDWRFDPEQAIHSAVDYGAQNLAGLQAKNFDVNSLSDSDKAKVIYLCHHLGIGDAQKFIQKTISESHAQYLLEQQVGTESADDRAEKAGSHLTAHRKWLNQFVNDNIVTSEHMCSSKEAIQANELLAICESLKPKTKPSLP